MRWGQKHNRRRYLALIEPLSVLLGLGLLAVSANLWISLRKAQPKQENLVNPPTIEHRALVHSTPPKPESGFHNIFFLHVGKTGGETVKSILRAGCLAIAGRPRREKCLSSVPSSRLSDCVKSYAHYELYHRNQAIAADSFLMSIRNPLARSLSWYSYVHPTSCQPNVSPSSPSCSVHRQMKAKKGWTYDFFTCFPQARDWASALSQATQVSEHCSTLAWNTFTGNHSISEHGPGHMTRNMGWYAFKSVFRSAEDFRKPLLIIRTEHLWQDIVNLERYLGGSSSFGDKVGSAHTHGSEGFKVKRGGFDEQGTRMACCALRAEFDIFRSLLFKAANLGEEEKEISWRKALESCGFDTTDSFRSWCSSNSRRKRNIISSG